VGFEAVWFYEEGSDGVAGVTGMESKVLKGVIGKCVEGLGGVVGGEVDAEKVW
jgi:hypothetical protein